jgi:sugar lactone lactonase YvrE
MKALTLTGLFVAVCSLVTLAQAPTPAPCVASGATQFVCGVQAPEDLVVLPGAQWVVASSYAGSGGVYLVRVSDRTASVAYPSAAPRERLDAKTYNTCPGPPDAAFKAKFQTHGLYLQPGSNSVHRLYVVVHGGREAVEVFEVDARPQTPTLTWIGCAVAPDPIGLNSVRALTDGGFVATNFLPRGSNMKILQSGEKNGELWEWHTASGWQKVPGSEASGANGLEFSNNDSRFYVASWGSQSFFRLVWPGAASGSQLQATRAKSTPAREEVPLGFRVDNIRWASDGSILAAGQGGAPGGPQASIVVKINPETLAVREIVRLPNEQAFGNGTVAVEVGKDLWIGSFRGDRIAIVPAAK